MATDEAPPGPLLRVGRDRRTTFVLVGGLNTLIGLGAFALLHTLLGDRLGYLTVLVLAYAIAVGAAYVLHRRLVFRVVGDFWGGLVRYTMVNLSSLGLNAVLLTVAVTGLGLPVLPSQAVCTLATVCLSYLAHLRFSFAQQHAGPGYPGEPVDDEERMLPEGRGRRVVRSGWLPALLVYALTVYLVRDHAQVAGRDVLAFSAYAVACLTLPGTLVWRLVRRGDRRPLLEDVVLGTLTGLVLELPVYLLGRAAGTPYATVLFSAAVVVGTLTVPAGRRLWRLGGSRSPRTRAAFNWAVSAAVAFTVLGLARSVWSVAPLSYDTLRRPYVDEPFHLALTGELRNHFPAEMPFVDGVPLFYHWFTYAHLASSSWVSGLEPVVLLRSVDVLLMVVLTVLGVAVASNRLSGRSWPGIAAAAVLAVIPAADVFGWTEAASPWSGQRFLSPLLYLSPTQTYAAMLSVLAVLLVWELLRRPEIRREDLLRWALTGLVLAALAGAKSTFLPVFLVGFLAVVAGSLLLQRRLSRSAALLAALTLALVLAARTLLYGGGVRSLVWDPFASTSPLAHSLGLTEATGPISATAAAVVLASYLLSRLAGFIGVVGLLRSGGWRSGPPQFVVAAAAASIGATFAFDHPGLSQFYFFHSATTVLVIGSAVGLARLFPEDQREARARSTLTAGAALVAGALLAATASALSPAAPTSGVAAEGVGSLRAVVVPQAVVLLVLAALAVASAVVARRRRWGPGLPSLLVVCLVIGLGLSGTAATLRAAVSEPWPSATGYGRPAIAPGGIAAARWLREHSGPDDLVATNAHCRWPGAAARCDHRNFWIAGYTERRVLVEGWAYIAPETVGAPSTDLTNSASGPFWDPVRLRDNDRAFTDPSAATLERLQRHGKVRWLFVDTRHPARVRGLDDHARLRFTSGRYRIYEVP